MSSFKNQKLVIHGAKRMAEAHGNRTHPPNRNRHGTTVLKTAGGTSPRALPQMRNCSRPTPHLHDHADSVSQCSVRNCSVQSTQRVEMMKVGAKLQGSILTLFRTKTRVPVGSAGPCSAVLKSATSRSAVARAVVLISKWEAPTRSPGIQDKDSRAGRSDLSFLSTAPADVEPRTLAA